MIVIGIFAESCYAETFNNMRFLRIVSIHETYDELIYSLDIMPNQKMKLGKP